MPPKKKAHSGYEMAEFIKAGEYIYAKVITIYHYAKNNHTFQLSDKKDYLQTCKFYMKIVFI